MPQRQGPTTLELLALALAMMLVMALMRDAEARRTCCPSPLSPISLPITERAAPPPIMPVPPDADIRHMLLHD